MTSLGIHWDSTILQSFALIMIRTSCILAALPIFSDDAVPMRFRICFALALSAVMTPLLAPMTTIGIMPDLLSLALAVMNEAVLGAIFGFASRMFFDGLIMAASLVGFQMGFGTADLVTGDSSTQVNSFTAFHRVLVILIFLALNLHHIFFVALTETFQLIPPGTNFLVTDRFAQHAVLISANIFPIALKLAAPVLVSLLFTMAAMGLMARAVPQLNVFTMSFPVSFFLGLFIYMATLPFLPGWLHGFFEGRMGDLVQSLKLAAS